jgi:hypothetical protein
MVDRPTHLQYDPFNATKVRGLVGKSVMVLWRDQSGKDTFYQGRVTKYDSVSDKHTVEYTDGDVKSYDMSRKTFRILDEGFTYKPTGMAADAGDDAGEVGTATAGFSQGGAPAAAPAPSAAVAAGAAVGAGAAPAGAGAAPPATTGTGAAGTGAGSGYGGYGYTAWERVFPGYHPKHKNVLTECTFEVYLDASCLDAGDRVVLLGTMDQLGGWTQGVPLEAHPSRPHVWHTTVVLPFQDGETCVTGIFEYKFGIRAVTGDLATEGGKKRLAETMSRHKYANYVHTTARRFRNSTRPTDSFVASTFLARALADFERGLITAPQVLEVFDNVDAEFEPTRATLMALLNNHIKNTPVDADQTTADLCVLLVTAMIGKLGRTSRERAPLTYNANFYSYNTYAPKVRGQALCRAGCLCV